jgi:hypothetical protein
MLPGGPGTAAQSRHPAEADHSFHRVLNDNKSEPKNIRRRRNKNKIIFRVEEQKELCRK